MHSVFLNSEPLHLQFNKGQLFAGDASANNMQDGTVKCILLHLSLRECVCIGQMTSLSEFTIPIPPFCDSVWQS